LKGKLTALRDQLYLPLAAGRSLSLELALEDLALLESFCHESDPATVLATLQVRSYATAAADLGPRIAAVDRGRRLRGPDHLRLFLGKGKVVALPVAGGADQVDPAAAVDLSELSREDPRVGVALLAEQTALPLPAAAPLGALESSRESFRERVSRLAREGLLVPDVGALDWGDLRRRHPLCPAFGYTRGTPVDRYYLHQYIREHREQVRGRVLEVGGRLANRIIHQYNNATEYRTLDLGGGADDMAGDAADPSAVAEGSVDCIIAFHVLEHCPAPHVVIDNFWRWLAPGGTALVAVPTAQKIHSFPLDCWRPQPDGMRSLFRSFSAVHLRTYGNLVAVIANLCGIAAEELSAGELADFHPDDPVLVCVAARR
jgi:SAM-dependent methyltransferase